MSRKSSSTSRCPRCWPGLFKIVETLFEVSIREDQAPVWHESVRFYRIDQGGQPGRTVLPGPRARTGKRGGAWMDDVRARWLRPDTHQLANAGGPSGLQLCQRVDGRPALLTHDDVTTLFHEFGHGLQHLLTQVNERDVSGISGVEWDAVELPSQFMENFCWEWDVLKAT
jgi:oligopeptidase A